MERGAGLLVARVYAAVQRGGHADLVASASDQRIVARPPEKALDTFWTLGPADDYRQPG